MQLFELPAWYADMAEERHSLQRLQQRSDIVTGLGMGRANPGGCFSELQSLQPLAVWHEVPDTTARGADWWCLGLSLCVTLVLSISRLEQYRCYVGRLFRLLAASVFCFLRCNSTAVGLREWWCCNA